MEAKIIRGGNCQARGNVIGNIRNYNGIKQIKQKFTVEVKRGIIDE